MMMMMFLLLLWSSSSFSVTILKYSCYKTFKNAFDSITLCLHFHLKSTKFGTVRRKPAMQPVIFDAIHNAEDTSTDPHVINRLTPSDPYMCRTKPLTSKRCIFYIFSTNIGTEYFKLALYSPFFLFKMQFVS